jgi:adenylyltransferase/sulfurtransferase
VKNVSELDDRYEALRRIEDWDQSRLQQATSLIVGVGALGNEVAKNLALIGMGRIILVDFDTVTLSNLSRSVLFRLPHLGKSKVEAAAETLREINSDVQVITIDADIRYAVGLGVFRRTDIIFGCVDNVAARYYINRNCWQVSKPWIDGGISETIGLVKVFQPTEEACYECTMTNKDRSALSPRRKSCSQSHELTDRPSLPTSPLVSAIAAASMVHQGIKLLNDERLGGQAWQFNLAAGEMLHMQYSRDPNCFTHSQETIKPVIEISASATNLTLNEVFNLANTRIGLARLEFGRMMISRFVCPHCAHQEVVWLHRDQVSEQQLTCPVCNKVREPEYIQSIGLDDAWTENLLPNPLTEPLAALGVPPLDILIFRREQQTCFLELTGDADHLLNWSRHI